MPGADRPRSERVFGFHPVLEALRARRRRLVRLRIRRDLRPPERAALTAAAAQAELDPEEVAGEELETAAPGRTTQGVVLDAGPLPELSLEALSGAGASPRTLVALDGVEDPQNLGAIVRVAEAAGVAGLILTRRRAPPLSPAVARASAGAIEWLPVARVPNLPRALEALKKKGFWVFGADPEGNLDLFQLADRILGGDRLLVLGAEGRGLRPGIHRAVDYRVKIPMVGQLGSLNVAAAAAVMLFEFRRRGVPDSEPPVTGVVGKSLL